MDLAARRNLETSPDPGAAPVTGKVPVHEGPPGRADLREEAGVSAGINISPGSQDDGWVVPQPVDLSDGTRVQLYKDGEALQAAYSAIENAKRRVCLEAYIFADDDTGCAFADLLCRKARHGVGVYVIYDSFGSFNVSQFWKPKPPMFDRMRRAGVRMQEFHPMRPWETQFSWRPVNRDHRKLLVVDDQIGGLGGLNVGREYAGSWVIKAHHDSRDLWRDNAIGVVGQGARHLLRAFAATWNYCTHGGHISRSQYEYAATPDDRDMPFGLLASVPTMSSPLGERLCALMRGARKSIEITMAYFAPDGALIDELVRAARRGVKVRLMLPARSDVKALIWAAQSFYECLMEAGVEIYERQCVVLHAKTMCIDGRISIVGSMNLDTRSIEYNLESSAIVRDERFGRQMHTLFENDVRYARRIHPEEWRRRPWRDRIIQWCVNRGRYLL
jgi:cardiolipin synthase